MLSPKHARGATFLFVACCVPILLLSVFFLYPRRTPPIAISDPENKEYDAVQAKKTSTSTSTSSKPTSSPKPTAASLSTEHATQITSPAPTSTFEITYPLPEDDNTEGFLSAALGNPETRPVEADWSFDTARDGGDYGLSDSQCDAAFPQLYTELHRAVAYTHTGGNITVDDVDISWKEGGVVRAMIYNRELYIIEAKYNEGSLDIIRAFALLGSIHRAITAFDGPIPNIEFTFSVEDIANLEDPGKWPLWALARPHDKEEQWVMPDFGFWAWDTTLVGSYEQVRQGIAQQEPSILEKKPQAIWRGANLAQFNPIRQDLLDHTRDKEWADVHEVVWEKEHNEQSNQFIKIREWVENYHHLLVAEGPHQNYVQVERDFSDLSEKIETLLDDPLQVELIANNSVATFRDRYLTPAAQACYWRRLFWAWRSVSFEPQLFKKVEIPDPASGTTKMKAEWRGEPYQTYVMAAVRDLAIPPQPKKRCGWISKALRLC
ncbi:MAG: hypothetical protein Q9157_002087 [Trypethelium eluteriae]